MCVIATAVGNVTLAWEDNWSVMGIYYLRHTPGLEQQDYSMRNLGTIMSYRDFVIKALDCP